MFCSKCGAELPEGSKFCSMCGTTITPNSNNKDEKESNSNNNLSSNTNASVNNDTNNKKYYLLYDQLGTMKISLIITAISIIIFPIIYIIGYIFILFKSKNLVNGTHKFFQEHNITDYADLTDVVAKSIHRQKIGLLLMICLAIINMGLLVATVAMYFTDKNSSAFIVCLVLYGITFIPSLCINVYIYFAQAVDFCRFWQVKSAYENCYIHKQTNFKKPANILPYTVGVIFVLFVYCLMAVNFLVLGLNFMENFKPDVLNKYLEQNSIFKEYNMQKSSENILLHDIVIKLPVEKNL